MCEHIFVCLVCSQLEGEMFFITNQACLVATGGMSNLRCQFDSILCQNRQTETKKTIAIGGILVGYLYLRFIVLLFKGTFLHFRKCITNKKKKFFKKQIVIFLNTIKSTHLALYHKN